MWDLPFGRGRRCMSDAPLALDVLLGGWQLAGVNTVDRGRPGDPHLHAGRAFQVSGIQQDFRGANNYRPERHRRRAGRRRQPHGAELPEPRHAWCIPTDPSQPFGNAERNSVRGPLFWRLDVLATKRIPMPWPQGSLELRVEAFNLLNRSNFRAPNGNRSAANFGTITSTYDPRILQFGVKLSF